MIEALIGIAALFFIYLILKRWLSICAICAASASTWIVLLALIWTGRYDDLRIVALLIGMSMLGLYHLLEKHSPDALRLFRLPSLLTLIAAGYSLLGIPDDIFQIMFFLSALWMAFLIMYLYRRNRAFSDLVEKIIACCRDW